jgi:hypothetical protein
LTAFRATLPSFCEYCGNARTRRCHHDGADGQLGPNSNLNTRITENPF